MKVEKNRRNLRRIEIGITEGRIINRGRSANRKIEAEIERMQMRIETTTHSMRVGTRSNRPFELKPLSKLRPARVDQRKQKGLREDWRLGLHLLIAPHKYKLRISIKEMAIEPSLTKTDRERKITERIETGKQSRRSD
jgi:hypothetical protein